MQNLTSRVVSISLDVISRDSGRKVKTSRAQLRIEKTHEDVLRLLTACEEGRLISLEDYDPETGVLVGDELSEIPPELQLSVRTSDVLSVEYGRILLQHIDAENLTETDREGTNLLAWIEENVSQMGVVQAELFDKKRQLRDFEAVMAEKQRMIDEMETDYRTILNDVEDRFFQVLESKKRRIAQLEGENPEDFALLNEKYKRRQKSNLKILNLEDIIVGEKDRKYGERRLRKRPIPRTTRVKKERERRSVKKEPEIKKESASEIKQEETDLVNRHLFVDDAFNDNNDNDNNNDNDMDIDNLTKASDMATETETKTPELNSGHTPGSEAFSGSELAADVTDYSEADDDDAGHVQSGESTACGAGSEDDGNETEYSD
ncbi:hypothetical protein HF325_003815 [Metschnikowia pulcherrima]|uniref:Uncharacterized protein n=1 Tax=Metschnikowia pulcherrima TaxID=27326 RepID=A0A8H7GPM3_9ASCO|nr:hypothetical protein HF325_003815 [Metschnikowia pulcherrima]